MVLYNKNLLPFKNNFTYPPTPQQKMLCVPLRHILLRLKLPTPIRNRDVFLILDQIIVRVVTSKIRFITFSLVLHVSVVGTPLVNPAENKSSLLSKFQFVKLKPRSLVWFPGCFFFSSLRSDTRSLTYHKSNLNTAVCAEVKQISV